MDALWELGLWNVRGEATFIPRVYLDASRESRLDLLRGLMDTGGWVERRSTARFCSTSERLAQDVAELVRSLGGWCSVRRPTTTCRDDHDARKAGRPAFVCKIQCAALRTIVSPSAKRCHAMDGPCRPRRPLFVSIEPTRVTATQCIAVTHPSRLYVTDDYVVTHNTAFALNIAQHVGVTLRGTVLVLSLEMSAQQLVQRMLCSEAKVDAQAVRTGFLSSSDWHRLTAAAGRLSEAKIFIDDSPGVTVLEARAKARRMKAEHGLDMLVVDYLQLMRGRASLDNRQQEISEISRSLKALAKELNIPVVALSQLSRAVEARAQRDFRPQLSDLRECVTGETPVLLADGRRVPIQDLVDTAPEVFAMSEAGGIVCAKSDRVWRVGRRPVVRVTLASGRALRATADHRLFSGRGWVTVEQLAAGDRLAVARKVPEPAMTDSWPEQRVALLGQVIGDGRYAAAREAFGQRSYQKRVPDGVFLLSDRQIALFLRHLWAADGTIAPRRTSRGGHSVFYATNSSDLAGDVAALLLRLGIVARLSTTQNGRSRPVFFVSVSGADDQRRFLATIGAVGPRASRSNVAPSRAVIQDDAALLDDDHLREMATNDLFWDRIVAIQPDGEDDVFDLTVPGVASWLADGIVSHNSGALEQDADVILFLYRAKVYKEDVPPDEENIAEVIIGKQRNGPIGTVKVVFLPQYARFENAADLHRQTPGPF